MSQDYIRKIAPWIPGTYQISTLLTQFFFHAWCGAIILLYSS